MIYNLKNDKRGMTLIEMIISLVILSILMTSTMGMITSSMSIFTSTSQAALDKMVGNSVFQTLESATKYATHLKINDAEENTENENYMQSITMGNPNDAYAGNVTNKDGTSSGNLWYKLEEQDPVNLYTEGFYNNRTVQYVIQKAGTKGQHLRITVKVYRDGEQVYTRESLIKCVNLGLLRSGANRNTIDDSDLDKNDDGTPKGVNQNIYFTTDELLVYGGESAWAIEYKLADYMNKYNKILKEYKQHLDIAQKPLSDLSLSASYGNTVSYAALMDAVNRRDTAIFGSGGAMYSPTGSNECTIGDEASQCKNLRQYYQGEIYKLLYLSPKDSYSNNPSDETYVPTTIDGVPNPYYGVIATKEQLFAGFLLTYYSVDDNHQVVNKDSFPTFDNPSSYFSGSIFASPEYKDDMVISAYFKDNHNYDYDCTDFFKTMTKTFDFTQELNKEYDTDSKNNWKSIRADQFTNESYPASATRNLNTGSESYCTSIDEYYTLIGAPGVGQAKNMYAKVDTSATTPQQLLASVKEGNEIYPSACFNAVKNWFAENQIELKQISIKEDGNAKINSKDKATRWVRSDTGPALEEGWYYATVTKSQFASLGVCDCHAWYVFYLEGSETTEAGDTFRYKEAVHSGDNIEIFERDYDTLNPKGTGIRYQQALFKTSGSTISTVGTKDIKMYLFGEPHQYVDYIQYAVDWDSWYGQESGLINKLLGATLSWISNLIGGAYSTNITSITAANPMDSLGRTGKYTVNDVGINVRSYNYAWMVYNSNRATWYYVPSSTNRLDGFKQQFSAWLSDQSNPMPLDLTVWKSSSAMINQIENRKLTASALLGLTSTPFDVLWVALPSVDTVSEEE